MKTNMLFIIVIFLSLTSFIFGERFEVYDVNSFRRALGIAEVNNQPDIIEILPGIYNLEGHPLRYEPAPNENQPLHIKGIVISKIVKPIIDGGGYSPLLLDIDNSEMQYTDDSNAHVFIEDVIFRGAGATDDTPRTVQYSYLKIYAVSIKVYNANVTVRNCIFCHNHTITSGTGLAVENNYQGTVRIYNNFFHDNITASAGGGLLAYGKYNTVIYVFNNTFTENTCSTGLESEYKHGGGAVVYYDLHTTEEEVYHYNEFMEYEYDYAAIRELLNDRVKVVNNIIWGNNNQNLDEPDDLYLYLQLFVDGYSEGKVMTDWYIKNNQMLAWDPDYHVTLYMTDEGNKKDDPKLDSFYGISEDSPCIDTGFDDRNFIIHELFDLYLLDYYGNPRLVDYDMDGEPIIDRGAVEYSDEYMPWFYIPFIFVPPDNWPWRDDDNNNDNVKSLNPPYYFKLDEAAVNSSQYVGWTVSNNRTETGEYCLYYGNPDINDYYTNNVENNGTITMKDIDIKNIDEPYLFFRLYMDTEKGDKYDTLEVFINDDCVWQKNSQNVVMKEWQNICIDLQKYKDKQINIKIIFDTKDDLYNETEGVYINNFCIIPLLFISNIEGKNKYNDIREIE